MLVNAMSDNRLVPIARNGDTAKNDGEQKTDPPADQNDSGDDGYYGKPFDGKQAMVKYEQRQPRDGDRACEDDLDCPIVKQEPPNMVQTQHQLMPPKPEVHGDYFIDIQSVSQKQSNDDQKVIGAVASNGYPATHQA